VFFALWVNTDAGESTGSAGYLLRRCSPTSAGLVECPRGIWSLGLDNTMTSHQHTATHMAVDWTVKLHRHTRGLSPMKTGSR